MKRLLIMAALPLALTLGCAHQEQAKKDPTPKSSYHNDVPTRATAQTDTPASGCSADTDCGSKQLCIRNACVDITAGLAECSSVRVHFPVDSDQLPNDARNGLERSARCLKADHALHVTIEGNADERGTEDYNMALGDRRANTVAKYMEALGASEQQLRTISYGKEKPLCTEHDEACWAQNRRAELHAKDRDEQEAPLVRVGLLLLLAVGQRELVAGEKPPVVIEINGTKRDLFRIAVPPPVGDAAISGLVGEVVANDLALSSWFRVIDPRASLANLPLEGTSIVVEDWRNAGAEGVSKGRATVVGEGLALEMKLYEIGRGDRAVVEKTYKGTRQQARRFAHDWSNEVVRYFTGEEGFFDSRIAFVAPTGRDRKDLFVMDFDGNGLANLTNNGSRNILPAWSPSGKEIVFTSFLDDNPNLYVMSASGGAPKKISNRPGLNLGASWSPDGTRIAVTLSQTRNAEIYVLATDGAIVKRLTENPFIDSSPAWSPDGSRIAFVSNRHGSPQIWLMSSTGNDKTRLTHAGNYNQEPAWCPRCARPTIAFTARDTTGNFDCFTIDVASGQLTRLTEGQGSNEHPSWAPNGRAIAVASSRGGIWILSADGKTQRQVYKGDAFSPSWGPSNR